MPAVRRHHSSRGRTDATETPDGIPASQKRPAPLEGESRLPVSGRTIALLFCLRVFLAFTIRSAESPDEWWQSTEVAYHLVFGKGHLTWEWKEGIRSVVFPCVFALPFYLLKTLGLDTAATLYASERLTQACIATGVDLTMVAAAAIFDCALRKDGLAPAAGAEKGALSPGQMRPASPSVVTTTLWMAVFQWYLGLCGSRAYSNVAEGLLVMLAVLQNSYAGFMFVAGFACTVRVTAALALIPVFFYHFTREVRRRGIFPGLGYCAVGAVVIAAITVGLMMSMDYLFYGRWILTPYKFFEVNIVLKVSALFGSHHPAWYFYCGFPVIVGPHIVALVLLPAVMKRLSSLTPGGRRAKHTEGLVLRLVGLLLWTLSVHSAVPHKETRFMFQMLPLALVLASFVISVFMRFPTSMRCITVLGRHWLTASVVAGLHRTFLLVNVVLLVILGYVYRQGGPGVMAAIRNSPRQHFGRVDIPTHCYFTPGYGQVHGKVDELRMIDCSVRMDPVTGKPIPSFNLLFNEFPEESFSWMYQRTLPDNIPESKRETEEFKALVRFLEANMPASEKDTLTLPDSIVVFESLSRAFNESFFIPNGYVLEHHVFHAPVNFEPDEDPYVDIWLRPFTPR